MASPQIIPVVALAFLMAGAAFGCTGQEPPSETAGPVSISGEPEPSWSPSPGELDEIAVFTEELVSGRTPTVNFPSLHEQPGPTFVVARAGGRRVDSEWSEEGSTDDAVVDAVGGMRARTSPDEWAQVDTIELVATHSYRDVDLTADRVPELTNVHLGVRGIELTHGGSSARYAPTWMLAHNWSFSDVIEEFSSARGLSEDEAYSGSVTARAFEADQLLVKLNERPTTVVMMRGNEVVPVDAVDEAGARELAELMTGWLRRNVDEEGRMTYKYWPSRGEESSSNNMIRQWMATTALGRATVALDEAPDLSLVRRNIDYNLRQFYREENGLGLIFEQDEEEVKLGAVALAALALMEHPEDPALEPVTARLLRTMDHLWQENGSFRTFYLPADRNDQENFYPGEALYAWSGLYQRTRDPQLLAKIMRSFRYYREWHLDPANRNPAFVPWHTQAYANVWRQTKDERLAQFIFEMNDWLLGIQEWEDAPYPDVRGRFYDADRPHFGPPHASATGVYLEGLVDAFTVARELGDENRAEAYRLAILRGFRSLMQLQFTDEVDMYYISQRDRVFGGLRTTVYDNEIRVDNVQHGLMGALKVLDTFEAADYDM